MADNKPTSWSYSKKPPISNSGTVVDKRITTISPANSTGYIPLNSSSTDQIVANTKIAIQTDGKITYQYTDTIGTPENPGSSAPKQFNNLQEMANAQIPGYTSATTNRLKDSTQSVLTQRTKDIIIDKTTEASPYAKVDPNATNSEQTLSQNELKDISKNTNDLVKVQQLQDKAFRTEYGNYKYPIKFPDEQDRITFKMFRYNPKTLAISENDLGVFQGGNKGKEIFGSVTLPITPSITDLNTVNWGSDEMNALQALAAAASYNTITTGVKGAEQSVAAIAEGLLSGKGDIAKAAAAVLAGEAAGGNKTFLSRVTGAVLNPNMELLFNGPQLRTHSFSFTLSAREEKESKEIRNIIRFFKQGMSVKRASSNLFLKAPNIFDISYHYRDQKDNHPWINQIKTCALTSCQVNYTPAGNYATYYDGSMTSYELTLSFSEIDPIFEDDYHKIDGSVNGPINDIGY